MSERIERNRVAFMVANEGVEQVELTTPWEAVKGAGRRREEFAEGVHAEPREATVGW